MTDGDERFLAEVEGRIAEGDGGAGEADTCRLVEMVRRLEAELAKLRAKRREVLDLVAGVIAAEGGANKAFYEAQAKLLVAKAQVKRLAETGKAFYEAPYGEDGHAAAWRAFGKALEEVGNE